MTFPIYRNIKVMFQYVPVTTNQWWWLKWWIDDSMDWFFRGKNTQHVKPNPMSWENRATVSGEDSWTLWTPPSLNWMINDQGMFLDLENWWCFFVCVNPRCGGYPLVISCKKPQWAWPSWNSAFSDKKSDAPYLCGSLPEGTRLKNCAVLVISYPLR